MSSSSSSKPKISDVILPLKSAVSPQLFESVQRDLCMRESSVESEKNLLNHKIRRLSTEHDLLDKQLRQVRSEFGNSILKESEMTRELTVLRADNISKTQQLAELLQRETDSAKQLFELRLELKQLRQCLTEMKAENEDLREKAEQTASREEVRVWNEKYEEAAKAAVTAEETARKEKAEKEKLKLAKDAVVDAATDKIRDIQKRVDALERIMTTLKVTVDNLDELGEAPSFSGPTPQEQNCRPVGTEVTDRVQQKSLGTNAKKHSSVSHPICISDSDGEDEAKRRKRKLDVKVRSVDSSVKRWESEADMVEDLKNNPEICMRAVCALYRQHMTVEKSKGFSDGVAFRGMILGKFLVDGDIHGGLRKSVTQLMNHDRDGPDKCRGIAIDHSSRLFEIYMNKEDSHFAPPQ